MNPNDQQAITALFEKLAQVERQTPARDPQADRLIATALAAQPGAPYYMAQTILVQDHALGVAHQRIKQLEAELAAAPASSDFLTDFFTGGPSPKRPAARVGVMPQGAPGGFLAGAAQTALGVAGGLLLVDAVADLFATDARAAEAPGVADPDQGDEGFDDLGLW